MWSLWRAQGSDSPVQNIKKEMQLALEEKRVAVKEPKERESFKKCTWTLGSNPRASAKTVAKVFLQSPPHPARLCFAGVILVLTTARSGTFPVGS